MDTKQKTMDLLNVKRKKIQIAFDEPEITSDADKLPSGPALASQPTMTRLENCVSRKDLLRVANVFGDLFIQSFDTPPEAVIIDLEPTVDLCTACRR